MNSEHLRYDERMDFILGGDRIHNAVVFMEGFDHMIVSLVSTKGWSVNPSSMQTGRFAGQCARVPTGGLSKTLPTSYSTIFAGFAVRGSSFTSGVDFYTLRAGATNTCRISCNASGILQVRNSSGTVIATGTTVLPTNNWQYIEVKLVIAGASGSIELHLNGVSGEIASTTGNFGSSNIDTVLIAGITGQTTDFDDMYCVDTTGSSPRNTFLGDVRVATIMANADGAHTAWTPSAAGSHFSKVNEISGTFPDGDTTYVSDSTPGDIDTYVFDDIDGGATVYAVQTSIYARKDDAATRQIAPVIRQSSTDYVGTTVTLTSTYAFYTQLYAQDPTPADWTAGNVNADEFGVKEIA